MVKKHLKYLLNNDPVTSVWLFIMAICLLASIVILLYCLTFIGVDAHAYGVASDMQDMAMEVVELVNIERAAAGVNPVIFSQELSDLAGVRAKEAAVKWEHMRPDGSHWSTVLCETSVEYDSGIVAYKRAGENLARNAYTAQEAMEKWLSSELGHMETMLNPDYDLIGVAVYSDSGTDDMYWVQIFVDSD